MKRARKEGPTSPIDVYPQTISWNISEGAADAFVTTQVVTPISRLPKRGNKITVMELLYLDVFLTTGGSATTPLQYDATNDSVVWQMSTGVSPSAFLFFGSGNVLAQYGATLIVTTSGMIKFEYPNRYNFCGPDGKGILLATDAFNFNLDSNGTGFTVRADCKLCYRFVDVSIEEYVGIVQSQQSA